MCLGPDRQAVPVGLRWKAREKQIKLADVTKEHDKSRQQLNMVETKMTKVWDSCDTARS